jgi:hypothetical protein
MMKQALAGPEGITIMGRPLAMAAQVAFVNFRFEEEAGEAVLYLYEIQVDQQAQVGMLRFAAERTLGGGEACMVACCGLLRGA